MIRCPQCGSERFILPRSPLAEVAAGKQRDGSAAAGRRTWSGRMWLLPLLAALITALLLTTGYWFFLHPSSKGNTVSTDKASEERTPAERLRRSEKYLAEGSFRLAVEELHADPHSLDPAQRRRWQRLQRESAVLADLCAEPIEDILQHAFGVPEREWQADFPRRYLDKSFLFDTLLHRNNAGKVSGMYFFPAPEKVRLEFGELSVLRELPLDQPRRAIIGVRLASIALEPPGPSWVVRFQPESGVLLTEPQAAGLCCPAFNEPDAVRVLQEQKRLADQEP